MKKNNIRWPDRIGQTSKFVQVWYKFDLSFRSGGGGGKNKKNSYFFPITILGHMPLGVGRAPGYGTVLHTGRGGSRYTAPPMLSSTFTDDSLVRSIRNPEQY